MAQTYKTPSLRSASAVSQTGAKKRIESEDKTRWAISANRKRSLPNHRFDVVEVWTLKTRDENGKVVTVDTNRSEEAAREFVYGEK